MDCIKKKVKEELDRGWIGCNKQCEYNPCHYTGQDCTYCYCPLYPCHDDDLGKFISSRGKQLWSCQDCLFIHRGDVCRYISSKVSELGISDPNDSRLKGMLPELKRLFFRLGKAIMVVGATSDAGKSLTVVALCRILSRRGFSVSPLKTQNMSLNSRVTSDGSEVATIQILQAKAAGLRHPDHHLNPILLKPKGDSISQVIVNGRPFGDFDVNSYYSNFVPGPGIKAVKETVEWLKKRYDFIIMEGAGSPAEINIYDVDIANMRAAEIADADCILVVNMEWGGAFAYVYGTVALLPDKDRSRIKGIILNNMRGAPTDLDPAIAKIEDMLGIPVLGVVPHADIELPTEDSMFFNMSRTVGDGSVKISVIKLPRISNFTDTDPFSMEDTKITFVDRPEELAGSDMIIIPGTKNSIDDMKWMKATGMDTAVKDLAGKIPIIGICGGYQMMGRRLSDPLGIEGGTPCEIDGLGLLDMVTEWRSPDKRTMQVEGKMIVNGGCVRGYEIHTGMSTTSEHPLFTLSTLKGEVSEGSVREDEKLFGTYLHGVFDLPAFRRYVLSFTSSKVHVNAGSNRDYSDVVDENIDKLADVFADSLDMDMFYRLFTGCRE